MHRNIKEILKQKSKCIVFVGLMGSGKSTMSKRLARRLGMQAYDSDKEIENRLGLSVVDIYDLKGRDFFKEKEREVVETILGYESVILSTGSDTFIDEDLRKLIKQRAYTIWLEADIDTLYNRIIRRNTRPEIDRVEDKRAALQNMIDKSYSIYAEADIKVTSHDMDPHYVLDTIIVRLQKLIDEKLND